MKTQGFVCQTSKLPLHIRHDDIFQAVEEVLVVFGGQQRGRVLDGLGFL